MLTLRSDQQLISETYNNLLLEKQLNYDLDKLYNEHLVNESLLDTLRQHVTQAYDTATSAVTNTNQTLSDISKLPEKLTQYVNVALPQYIDNLSQFIITVLQSGAAGALATYVLGKLIMLLAKRIGKELQVDTQSIVSMLPAEVQDEISKIEGLKQINPAQYKKMVFQINRNAIKQLEKELVGTNKKIQRAVIIKSLDFLGSTLSSGPGSIVGGIVIAVIIQKLGFNPMPIFPTL